MAWVGPHMMVWAVHVMLVLAVHVMLAWVVEATAQVSVVNKNTLPTYLDGNKVKISLMNLKAGGYVSGLFICPPHIPILYSIFKEH